MKRTDRTGHGPTAEAAAACGRSEEVEELARSALRQAEIKRRIAEAEQKLKDRELARKGKRGRMKVHEQTIENASQRAARPAAKSGVPPGRLVMSTPSAPPARCLRARSRTYNMTLQAERRRPAACAQGGRQCPRCR